MEETLRKGISARPRRAPDDTLRHPLRRTRHLLQSYTELRPLDTISRDGESCELMDCVQNQNRGTKNDDEGLRELLVALREGKLQCVVDQNGAD